jgi:hypothetical protein
VTNTLVQVEQLQKFIQTYDYVSGDFMWTGVDYLGEAAWPAKGSSCGALDTCGFLKTAITFIKAFGHKRRCFIFSRTGIGRAERAPSFRSCAIPTVTQLSCL